MNAYALIAAFLVMQWRSFFGAKRACIGQRLLAPMTHGAFQFLGLTVFPGLLLLLPGLFNPFLVAAPFVVLHSFSTALVAIRVRVRWTFPYHIE